MVAKIRKLSFKFVWVLDKLKVVCEHGITVGFSVEKYETDKSLTITDAPGHRVFVNNTIAFLSQTLSIIPDDFGGAETAIYTNRQTGEHAFLPFTLGVKEFILSVNKMDSISK